MKRLTYILLLLLLSVTTRGQTLIGYEYWFDTDFPSKVYIAHTQSDISFDADISTFHQGTTLPFASKTIKVSGVRL